MLEIPARTRDQIAILGFTEHSYEAPWKDPLWDFAGLNDLHAVLAAHWPEIFTSGQVSWFQLHRRGPDGQYPGARDPSHNKWLTEQTFPIYMWEHDPAIPASVPYPIEEVLTRAVLPSGTSLSPEQYWNNSISWMIAWAILRGYKVIGLYGVDMAMDGVHGQSEYQHQRPSVEYIIGVARGLGIRVVMPQQSEICKCGYLYGWDNIGHFRKKLLSRYECLLAAEAEATNAYELSKRDLFQVRGAQQLLSGQCGPLLAKLHELIPQAEREKALNTLAQDEIHCVNQNEAAKRSLHETRGAKNQTEWELRNYFPGDGPIQDVPRTEASLVLTPVETVTIGGSIAPSDGRPVETVAVGQNRIIELVKDGD